MGKDACQVSRCMATRDRGQGVEEGDMRRVSLGKRVGEKDEVRKKGRPSTREGGQNRRKSQGMEDREREDEQREEKEMGESKGAAGRWGAQVGNLLFLQF